jgi:peptide deformylase
MEKTKLRIHFWGEKPLRKKCKPVKVVNRNIKDLFDQMYALMLASGGLGLAANQAGLDCRLLVIEAEGKVFRLVNPRINKARGEIIFEEGCLSFPGICLAIKRANKVSVSALDENGNPVNIEASGLLAVALQHEIDHLNGIVFIDRISFLQRLKLAKQLKKIKKDYP